MKLLRRVIIKIMSGDSRISIMQASGRLGPYLSSIRKSAQEAVSKIEAKIPLTGVDVVICDNPRATIPHLGIGGQTVTSNLVIVSLNPSSKFLINKIEEAILRTLAHELNHCARWECVGYGKTLLEAMISEGLADHFDEEISKGEPQSWSKSLSLRQIERFLGLAKEDLHNKNYNHTDWFFGSKTKKIPKWTGYSLGYYLVEEYLKRNSGKQPSDIYNLTALQFIKSDD